MAMVSIDINEEEARALLLQKVEERIRQCDMELTLWDRKELCRQTCMSWNTILKEFFYDQRFEKFKVGNKWKFPAKETRAFILKWLREQKNG